MTNENIQEIIIEHFTDGVEIPTEIKNSYLIISDELNSVLSRNEGYTFL